MLIAIIFEIEVEEETTASGRFVNKDNIKESGDSKRATE